MRVSEIWMIVILESDTAGDGDGGLGWRLAEIMVITIDMKC